MNLQMLVLIHLCLKSFSIREIFIVPNKAHTEKKPIINGPRKQRIITHQAGSKILSTKGLRDKSGG